MKTPFLFIVLVYFIASQPSFAGVLSIQEEITEQKIERKKKAIIKKIGKLKKMLTKRRALLIKKNYEAARILILAEATLIEKKDALSKIQDSVELLTSTLNIQNIQNAIKLGEKDSIIPLQKK